ncbi:hypothetical protein R1flu_010565 [Riccia fluitans]|uniref:Uncharacterized protein n=1 Tax=Riccia fluitans TaxID=41844 RepID=A0ABD1Z684_9MARC
MRPCVIIHTEKNEIVNECISRCLWENNIVPEVCLSDPKDPLLGEDNFSQCSQVYLGMENPRLIMVSIASLLQGLQEYLHKIYIQKQQVVAPDEIVGIYQFTHELKQGSGVEEDSQALV